MSGLKESPTTFKGQVQNVGKEINVWAFIRGNIVYMYGTAQM